MGDASTIEWTDATWNPTVGCAHVSPGCDGCYAAREAFGRLSHLPTYAGLAERRSPDELPRFTGEVRLLPERLEQPLRWRKPRRVFVDSMSDLFHPDVPLEFIDKVFDTMERASQHTYQVLTKRPGRMAYATEWLYRGGTEPLPNVWLGTSIESNRFTWRAEYLSAAHAAVRFVSAEPLLGPLPSLDLAGIDWLIVGCESGPRARPMNLDWARELRDRCAATGTAFFVKQLPDPARPSRPLHDIDKFPPDLRIREYPS